MNNNNHHSHWWCYRSAGNETWALHVSDGSLTQCPDTFGRVSNNSLYDNLTPPSNSMLNPTPVLCPFLPLCSIIPMPLYPALKKEFDFSCSHCITRFQRLTKSQSARLRLIRKPLVQWLKQLTHCAKLLEQSKNASKNWASV